MMVLITYDVNTETQGGKNRLRKIAKQCLNFGQRVQNSVFECLISPRDFTALKNQIEKIMDKKQDSIRYYFLGNNWKSKVDHSGKNETYDPEGPLII